jgi:hypothetical protein
MSKFFSPKLVAGLAFVALSSAMMLAPLQAHARGKLNCGWVLVSGTTFFGTYAWLCGGKGA